MVPRAKWMQLNIAVVSVCAARSLQEQVQICTKKYVTEKKRTTKISAKKNCIFECEPTFWHLKFNFDWTFVFIELFMTAFCERDNGLFYFYFSSMQIYVSRESIVRYVCWRQRSNQIVFHSVFGAINANKTHTQNTLTGTQFIVNYRLIAVCQRMHQSIGDALKRSPNATSIECKQYPSPVCKTNKERAITILIYF